MVTTAWLIGAGSFPPSYPAETELSPSCSLQQGTAITQDPAGMEQGPTGTNTTATVGSQKTLRTYKVTCVRQNRDMSGKELALSFPHMCDARNFLHVLDQDREWQEK